MKRYHIHSFNAQSGWALSYQKEYLFSSLVPGNTVWLPRLERNQRSCIIFTCSKKKKLVILLPLVEVSSVLSCMSVIWSFFPGHLGFSCFHCKCVANGRDLKASGGGTEWDQ